MSLIEDAVNTKEFRDKEGSTIREDELFFHKYFKLRPEKIIVKEENSEDEEEEIDAAFDLEEEEGEGEEFDIEEDYEDDEDLPVKKPKNSVFVDAKEYYS